MTYPTMNVSMETNDLQCEFCDRKFVRENSLIKHVCEKKRRWQEKDNKANVVGYSSWRRFYETNTNKKKNSYKEFINSSYYGAFVKFGSYCMNVNCINVNRYVDYLLDNKISIDNWNKDTHYTKYLLDLLKSEDPFDAIKRSVETTLDLAAQFDIPNKDVFRYGNRNKICYEITKGKISPWVLYQSTSGVVFLESLDSTQEKMIFDYINPEYWAIKFKKDSNMTLEVKKMLNLIGY
jgi:hypothetical protein